MVDLFKDGCEWQGDIVNNNTKWGECLFAITPYAKERAQRTLTWYGPGLDYKLDGAWDGEGAVAIWIAFK